MMIDWVDYAACNTGKYEPEWWYPVSEKDPGASKAIQVCHTCKVRQQCLDYAITADDRHGIWGGLRPHQRLAYTAARGEASGG